ncbi:hypothetical protein HU200_001502 [Digitaria exilis]|uniref:Uncharacterized protein n=1 Tax=Digitaria exilis TaxID=1010633 RepID=A0A835G0Y7_9POAL|nr:hypothetical protein HU200_001502 [Digitaria exilis]
MRAVSGEVVSSKTVTLSKAASVFALFAASEASELPAEAGAFVLSAAELHAFRSAAAQGREKARRSDAARSGRGAKRSMGPSCYGCA